LTKAGSLLTPVFIRQRLISVQQGNSISASTINRYRRALNSFFVLLGQEDLWPSNPVLAVKPVKVMGKSIERRSLTDLELRRLLESAPPHRSLIYRVAATTGRGRGEFKTLTWDMLSSDNSVISLRAENAKDRQAATIPLPASTRSALIAWKHVN
jgi:integrase